MGMLGIFIGIGNQLSISGLTASLIRDNDAGEEDFSTVFYFNIVGSILIYGLIYFLAPLIGSFYGEDILVPMIRILSLGIIINAFGAVHSSLLNRSLDFKRLAIISIPSIVLGGLVGVYLAYTGWGVWSLVWQVLTVSTVNMILFWVLSSWRPRLVFVQNLFKKHFGFGYKLAISGVFNSIFEESYSVLIGKYFSPIQLGFFQRGKSLSMLPVTALSRIVHRVSYPLLSKVQDNDPQLLKSYRTIIQMVAFVLAPLLVIMATMAEPLFRFLLTEKWLPAVPYFRILAIVAFLYPIHGFNLSILNVKGRSDLFLKAEVIKKILIAVIIVIAFRWGIYGLLYGSVIISLLSMIVNIHYSNTVIPYTIKDQMGDILPAVIIAVITGILIYTMDGFWLSQCGDFLRLIIGVSVGMIGYLTLSLMGNKKILIESLAFIKMIGKSN